VADILAIEAERQNMSDREMGAVEKELVKATEFKGKKFKKRSEYLSALASAVDKLDDDQFEALSDEASDWANAALEAVKSKEDVEDFDEPEEEEEEPDAEEPEEEEEDPEAEEPEEEEEEPEEKPAKSSKKDKEKASSKKDDAKSDKKADKKADKKSSKKDDEDKPKRKGPRERRA
jgi:hypothetical protein